jgi:hypothetical protein
VRKSTLATWCRDIELTTEQKLAIVARTGSRRGIPRDTQRKRHDEIERIRAEARHRAATLMSDPLWMAGTVLYWAEGSKTTRKLRLSHSEVPALLLFRTWVVRFLEREAEFRAALNLHADNDEPGARRFWGSALGLDPVGHFTKTFIKPDGTGHRKNHLPWGVCELKMSRSTDAWIRTMAWIDVMRRRCDRYPVEIPRAAGAIGSATDS